MNSRINKNPEKMLCSFIVAVVFTIFLTNMGAGFSTIVGVSSNIISTVLKATMGLMFILMIRILLTRLTKHHLVFVGCSAFVILIQFLLFPNLDIYFKNTVVTYVSMCMTTYIVCFTIEDYKELINQLVIISYVIAFLMIVFLFGVWTGRIQSFNEDHYSMGLGYSCAIPTIMLSLDYVQKKRIIDLVGVVVFIIAIITFGSRGPLLEVVLFITFFFLRYLLQKKQYIQSIILIIAVLVLLFTYKDLLMYFATFLKGIGINSRVIRTLTTETISLSGRDVLYQQLLPYIKESPFAIRGINAEWSILNVYAHNFIIELLYQLGVAVGGCIVLFVFVRVIKTLFITKFDAQRIVCVVFMFSSIPQLFFSGSIWTNYIFWMWMAMCSKLNIQHRQKEEVVQ